MKPFDLEAAKRGEPLITREGISAKFVAYVPEAEEGCQVIALCEDKSIRVYFVDGRYWSDPSDTSSLDLFMAPKKRILWVNIYFDAVGAAYHYESQEEADKYAGSGRHSNKAWPIEIEE